MRRVVYYEEGYKGSLIFIQDSVFQALNGDMRRKFFHWNCSDDGHKIRDDLHAKQAWYKFVPAAGKPHVVTPDQESA
ncbi:MAG: hypothetical protein HRU19_05535 [Pseudobacteriovorax sp.]|nr:hypothetical protein [Pseudobacteriovorax sp.]